MRNTRTKMYVKIEPDENEIVCAGIDFLEFMEYLSEPIQNILLLKGDYVGHKNQNNFEVIEGFGRMDEFKKESVRD